MIISHKYKYIFIQLEKTASTAIAKELEENYNGKKILWKHARYEDFLYAADKKQKKYFAFAGIRNPLDIAVSRYHLRKLGKGNNKNKNNLRQYLFIRKTNADFSRFFKKFYAKYIYDDWKSKKFQSLDYIYHYENLQKDFKELLKKIGIKQKRPLPLFNKTPEKKQDIYSYYTEDIQPLAMIIFQPYMKKHGYKFPKDWKKPNILQKIFIGFPLHIKHIFARMIHIFLDFPPIYKKAKNIP